MMDIMSIEKGVLGTESAPLKILVVDDTPANLTLLQTVLSTVGHIVISAVNGEEAVEKFQADAPDLILMDVMMPVMDGIEATRRIRALNTGRWVPIIFLSALTHRDDMVRGLEAGGDDYLPKPVDLVLLLAKIAAMQRIAMLEAKLRVSNDELLVYQKASEYQMDMARELMENIVSRSSVRVPGIDLWLQPTESLGGDLVVIQQYCNDRDFVLLADAMGHGLPAALPLLPLVQVFSQMARKGFTVPAMVREINSQLKNLLPTGNFVAVTLLSVDRNNRLIEIWNGGNPPALLLDAEGNLIKKFLSQHPALGLLMKEDFDARTEFFQWSEKGSLSLYSDGLVEAMDAQGIEFGVERIATALQGNNPHQSLKEAIATHLGGHGAHDDISLATIALS